MRIRLLGGLEVVSPQDQPVRFATRKTSLLFAALVLAGRRGARREVLSEAFWPGRGEAQARNSLRQALVDIRRFFPTGIGAAIHVEGDHDSITLIAGPDEADIWVFDRLAEEGRIAELATAADLYRGDVLAGVSIPGELDAWFAPFRSSYRQKALQLVEQMSLALPASGSDDEQEVEGLAERLLASEPAAEEAHRALIRLYQHRGKANAALRQFLLCKEALRRDLGVEPEDATRALIEGQGEVEKRPGATAPAPDLSAVPRERDQPSIVVLPFENLSGADDDFLVEGIVEEITATLSRVRDFFVIARQSAYAYKGRFVDLREIGKELGIQYAVEGTVRRAAERVRVTVKLVDTKTRTQIWSERYDRAATDIFALQDEIAAHVAGAVHPALLTAEIEAAMREPPGNTRAYELVLKAYPNIWSATAEDNRRAIAHLEQAIATDPNYGRAHALLAWGHAQNVSYLWSSDPGMERALALAEAEAASRLASNDPMALTAIGAALSMCSGDQDRAAAYVDEALALDPNSAWAWARSGWIEIFSDRPKTARQRFEHALALSPFDPLEHNFRAGIAVTHGLEGDYALGAKLAQRMLDKNPHVTWAYRLLAAFSALAGDLPTACDAIAKLRAANPGVSIAVMKTSHPIRHTPRVFDMFVEGWRLAGLPEE